MNAIRRQRRGLLMYHSVGRHAWPAAYSVDDFHRLMNEGIAAGDRQLDLMATVARKRFVHLTDQEELQLYSFLLTLVD